jgi:hypothetical protein
MIEKFCAPIMSEFKKIIQPNAFSALLIHPMLVY